LILIKQSTSAPLSETSSHMTVIVLVMGSHVWHLEATLQLGFKVEARQWRQPTYAVVANCLTSCIA